MEWAGCRLSDLHGAEGECKESPSLTRLGLLPALKALGMPLSSSLGLTFHTHYISM